MNDDVVYEIIIRVINHSSEFHKEDPDVLKSSKNVRLFNRMRLVCKQWLRVAKRLKVAHHMAYGGDEIMPHLRDMVDHLTIDYTYRISDRDDYLVAEEYSRLRCYHALLRGRDMWINMSISPKGGGVIHVHTTTMLMISHRLPGRPKVVIINDLIGHNVFPDHVEEVSFNCIIWKDGADDVRIEGRGIKRIRYGPCTNRTLYVSNVPALQRIEFINADNKVYDRHTHLEQWM